MMVRRGVIIGAVLAALAALSLSGVLSSRPLAPAGAKCPPTFSEFAVAPKNAGVVGIAGRVTDANGAPLTRGAVAINLTFMMPGCGALPFTATTEKDGRFSADSPPKDPGCVRQGGTATARTNAGCTVEGMTQGDW